MLSPHAIPIIALPKAWSTGTDGLERGRVVQIEIETEEDLERYRGKLDGSIVFLDEPFDVKPPKDPFKRHTKKKLSELAEFPIPDHAPTVRRLIRRRQ